MTTWAEFAHELRHAAEQLADHDRPEGLALAAAERIEQLAADLPAPGPGDTDDALAADEALRAILAAAAADRDHARSELGRLDRAAKALRAYGVRDEAGLFVDQRR